MFNFINNFSKQPNQTVETATSSDSEKREEKKDQEEKEKRHLDEEEHDEVRLGGLPILTEEEVEILTEMYINDLKKEHQDNEKVVKKLDKYLSKFDVKRFMKNNPNMTRADFYMIMYNETAGMVN
ncbi:hypothetical protein IJI31_00070 [bacterium]|nr:hypothetical protein [bacterium]